MPKRKTLAIAAIAGGLLIALGVLIALNWKGDSAAPRLTPEAARELIRNKNIGLGQLENQQLDAARGAFEQIATEVPGDPLGPRNVAVSRVVALGVEDEQAPEEAVAAAREALAKMAELEGQTADYHWLAFSADLAAKDFPAAETHVAALIAADANDPAAWYARYRVGRAANARELDPASREALAKAYELRPANAWLLVEWLRGTGSQLNEELDALPADDPERGAALAAMKQRHARLVQQLQAARPTAQAFAHVIQTHVRVDVVALLDQAAEAAGKDDWQTAATQMLISANVLLPYSVLDRQAVRRHPLELVLDRFRPEFYAANQVAEMDPQPPIAVKFAANEAWQVPAELEQAAGKLLDMALADYDLDGRLDLLLLGDQKLLVLGRQDDSQPWHELASVAGEGATGLVVQDLDEDFDETMRAVRGATGTDPEPDTAQAAVTLKDRCPTADVDVALYGPQGLRLLENRFDAATNQRTLIPLEAEKQPSIGAGVRTLICADLEADGDLDLALATEAGISLWRNNGDWRFADMSERAVLPQGLAEASRLVAFDWDRDVDIDILVAAKSGGGWLENLRHGQFRWRAFADEHPDIATAEDMAAIDADGNATWDLLTAGAAGVRLVPMKGPPAGSIKTGPAARLSATAAQRLLTWDYDNDGFEDCLAWSAAGVELLRGGPDGKFAAVDLLASLPQQISSATAGDVDGDGDEDLAIVAEGKLQLVENQGGNQNHWIDVALQAQQIKGQQLTASGRVSPYGVGSLLELKSGSRYQARVVRGQSTHFGLGPATQADVVRVAWLNGVPQNIIRPAADAFVCEQQILNTSCPYLYAWDGEKFVFVTDLLWNAPLGLQLAEGHLAPWRDWEYLKVPGQLLAPKDGHYVLQATAELWEADYIDHVQLIAVDHPADVEIYSNEKVGPPQIAEYKIHTVRQPQAPTRATNHVGRDLLPEIHDRDGIYGRTYERKLRQGVVEDHFLELDLGDLAGAERVTLFLTGWVYPASTSINVALSQGGKLQPPVPPSLEVPDGSGGWKTAIHFMGFPGGKTKTIAVEIPAEVLQVPGSKFQVEEATSKPEPGTRIRTRLRIRTSMEFYWDQIFFTVDEPPAEFRTTELPLVSADLHNRGYSRVERDETNAPERFMYGDVSTVPKWPPMLGNFTRYGDVRELLAKRDDRLVVMGAGDETTLRFAASAPALPAGWKRDFLLYSVGWDKDANLETVAGQSAEPLPFAAMTSYPVSAEQGTGTDQPPVGADYGDYLKKYQTRRQSNAYFSAVLGFPEAQGGGRPANRSR